MAEFEATILSDATQYDSSNDFFRTLIEEQKQLTPELEKKIQQSFDTQELEDIYLPFKKKKKTKGDITRVCISASTK